MTSVPPRILVIAGSDSSGGAGIQADIKTITMLGGYAMTAITAVTAQNTLGLLAVETLTPDLVTAQIDACLSDIGADAIKIGMLGSPDTAFAVADLLEGLNIPIVFDPVMVATSGSVLANEATIAAFERLMALASLTTPNLPELAALGGKDTLRGLTRNLLIKGGHSEGPSIENLLIEGERETIFRSKRQNTRHTHGTGCTLASAIATGLGSGLPLAEATQRAISFVEAALSHAPSFGSGSGPLGHQATRLTD